jgi:citrate lyase subunit beta/citryl-CoA lyase
MIARSYLYIPGNNASMLEKAHTRGADALIIDFEDAVAANEKEKARLLFSEWITAASELPQIWVRINPESIEADLAVADHARVTGIVVPKATVENMTYVSQSLEHVGQLSALIESAASILDARAIANVAKVDFLQIGQLDLRAELSLGNDSGSPTLNFALSMLVLASAAAGINQPVAPMYPDFKDEVGLRATCKTFKRDGFFGRSCIHPSQIAVVNDEFTTTADEFAHALAVLDAVSKSTGVAVDEHGKMIDAASVKIAQSIISRQ